MPDPEPTDNVGLQGLLDTLIVGEYRVRAGQITLTTIGRDQRQAGITQLSAAIQEHGFIDAHAPLCALQEIIPADALQARLDGDDPPTISCIDGNHRVSAAASIDEDMRIPAKVYSPMTAMQELMIAEGKWVDCVSHAFAELLIFKVTCTLYLC